MKSGNPPGLTRLQLYALNKPEGYKPVHIQIYILDQMIPNSGS